jgi:hypothetical protein
MHMGSRQRNGTGHSMPVDLKMNFAAAASAIRGVIPLTNRFYYLSAAKMNSKPVKEAN